MINIKRTLIIFGQKTAAEVHSAAKLGFHDHFDTIRTFVFNEELSENTDFNSVMNAGGDVFFIAATIDFQLKPRVIQFAESLGLKPFSIIHPSAFIDESAEICEGVFVGPQAVVSVNARIGNHSIIHIHSSIGHDSQIGEYCAILPGARISGDVVLEDHVLIGSNSFVFQGTRVGRNARIDALTYVRDDIPEKSTLSCRRSNH
jgi:hypothetical protein